MSARELQRRLREQISRSRSVGLQWSAGDEVTVTVTLTVPLEEVPERTHLALRELAAAVMRETRELRKTRRKRRDD